MIFDMELELDNIFVGTCITLIVCVISGILYYMFKHAAIISPSPPNITQETSPLKKKTKKQDTRKAKKYKKRLANLGSLELSAEQDVDMRQTSDETVDEDEPPSPLNFSPQVFSAESGSRSSSAENTDFEQNTDEQDSLHPNAIGTSTADGDLCPNLSVESKESSLPEYEACPISSNAATTQQTPSLEQMELVKASALPESSSISPSSLHQSGTKSSSKRSKRRGAKRTNGLVSTIDTSVNSSVPLFIPDVEHIVDPVEEVTSPTSVSLKRNTRSPSQDQKAPENEPEELNKLLGQLRVTERKLGEISNKAAHLSELNEQLRQKEEENRLGLHVLQEQYTELLRANKAVEHEKQLKEKKLKHLESEKKNLLMRLEMTNAEMNRLKSETEAETTKLREQLNESQAKLAAVASAKPAVPTSELVRTQELAQLMSNENRLLKSNLDMLKAELTQLRQSHLRQQQELQAFQVENLKLRENQDTALEELQAKFQLERAEVNSRISSYEAQLQRQSHDREMEKQELSRNLAEVKGELASRMDREKRLSEIISSLEYQFAELNAEKQRLLDRVNSAKVANESSTSELLIQVANLTNDLARTTSELHMAQQRADTAVAELERLKANSTQLNRAGGGITTGTQTISEDSQKKVVRDTTSNDVVEDLQAQLQASKRELKATKDDLVASTNLQESTQLELEHYKSTLMHTEDLLAKLQVMVEETESKWRKLLSDSESERDRLRKQLAGALSKTADMTERLERTEQKLGMQRKQPTRPQKRALKNSKTQSADSSTLRAEKPEDSCATPELAHITSSVVTSPQCILDESTCSPVGDDNHVKHVQPGSETPTTLEMRNVCPNEPERNSPEYKEVEGSWLELTHLPGKVLPSSPQDPRLCSDGLFRVHARPVSGANWSSDVKPLQSSQLGLPDSQADEDDDDDFDAVLVDDTDLHVPDDIWDTTTSSTTISGNFHSEKTTTPGQQPNIPLENELS